MTLPTAPFGRTGHDSTRVVFGAAALGSMRQERADEVLDVLLRAGVNHIDTAASYGDSELRVGPWMAEHRDRFFLATKTGERTGDAPGAVVATRARGGTDHATSAATAGHGLRSSSARYQRNHSSPYSAMCAALRRIRSHVPNPVERCGIAERTKMTPGRR